jgi:hypothetical protein
MAVKRITKLARRNDAGDFAEKRPPLSRLVLPLNNVAYDRESNPFATAGHFRHGQYVIGRQLCE